jgi:ADP-ribose pyrophosphatase
MGTYLLSPGGSSETMTFFCGKVDSRGLGGIHGLSQEGEDIRAFVQPWEKAQEALNKNLYQNATTVLALQWLSLNREELRRTWLSDSSD